MTYIGCYGDLINNNTRDLNGLSVWSNLNTGGTIETCLLICLGFKYAGVQYGYIWICLLM